MNCPSCASLEVRVAECLELIYELADDGTPADLINGEDISDGPGDFYYLCADCWHRWSRDGSPLVEPTAVPKRA
ncbi:MAG: hypothetical protein HY825_09530 [Acidobacteria bacterium]|nr:hypothetical protein [Acidobacteriota bacterium]